MIFWHLESLCQKGQDPDPYSSGTDPRIWLRIRMKMSLPCTNYLLAIELKPVKTWATTHVVYLAGKVCCLSN
jgi:hypothetical protein